MSALKIIYYTMIGLILASMTFLFVSMFFLFLFLYDPCTEGGICENGRAFESCPPSGDPCVISEERCRTEGVWKDNKCYLFSHGHTPKSVLNR